MPRLHVLARVFIVATLAETASGCLLFVDASLLDAGSSDSVAVDAGLVVDAGVIDAGIIDAGIIDAGHIDAGLGDGGVVDAGVFDGGVLDAGLVDAGLIDAGLIDAGLVDAGLEDAGLVDAGLVDAGLADAGLVDAGLVDAGPIDAGLVDAGTVEPTWIDPGPGPCGGAAPFVALPWHVSGVARFPVVVDPACVQTSAAGVHVPLTIPAGVVISNALARVFEGDLERAAEVEHGALGGPAVVWTRLDLIEGEPQRVLWVYLVSLVPGATPTPFDDHIAVWHMDDPPAEGQKSSTLAAGFAPTATPSSTNEIQRVAGQVGSAISATEHYHSVADHPLLDVTAGEPFTVDLWFRRSGGSTTEEHLLMKEATCVGYQLRMSNAGELFWMVSSGAGCTPQAFSQIYVPGSFRDGQWHHVVAGIDRVAGRLFVTVDGVAYTHANDVYDENASAANAEPLRLGASWNGGNVFAGELDEVRLHALPRDDARTMLEDAAARGLLVESGTVELPD